MKKIIVIFFAIFALPAVALAQGDRVNVQIVVSGFEDNAQALAVISKDVQERSKSDWRLVQSHPELILRVTAKTRQVGRWTEIDQAAARRNDILKTIERESQRAVRRIRHRAGNGWLRIGAQIGRNIAISKYVAPRYTVEKYKMGEFTSVVELELIDADTRKVISMSSGTNSLLVRGARIYGQEPVVEIASGDLSAVLDPGESPGGQLLQLLALSAYVEAAKSENQIATESDRPVARQRRAL